MAPRTGIDDLPSSKSRFNFGPGVVIVVCSQVHFGFEGLKEKDVEGGIHGVGTVLELVLNSRLVWVRNPRSILNSLEADMDEE